MQETILICLRLFYLRLLTSELMRESSSETDSFLMGVWSFLIRKIILRKKVRKEKKKQKKKQCSLWISGMWARLLLRSGGPRKLILGKSWRATRTLWSRGGGKRARLSQQLTLFLFGEAHKNGCPRLGHKDKWLHFNAFQSALAPLGGLWLSRVDIGCQSAAFALVAPQANRLSYSLWFLRKQCGWC